MKTLSPSGLLIKFFKIKKPFDSSNMSLTFKACINNGKENNPRDKHKNYFDV
jgi:hypothetical protein